MKIQIIQISSQTCNIKVSAVSLKKATNNKSHNQQFKNRRKRKVQLQQLMKQIRFKLNSRAKIKNKHFFQVTLIVKVLIVQSSFINLNKKQNSLHLINQYRQHQYKNHPSLFRKSRINNMISNKSSSKELKFNINKINLLIEKFLHLSLFNNRAIYLQSDMLLVNLANEMTIKTRKRFLMYHQKCKKSYKIHVMIEKVLKFLGLKLKHHKKVHADIMKLNEFCHKMSDLERLQLWLNL